MRLERLTIVLAAANTVLLLSALSHNRPAGGQAVATVLRASAFELVDGHGRVRSKLNVEPSGEVVLRLADQDGTIRVKLGAAKDGSGLVLLNDATEPGVHILATAAGTSLKLAGQDGRERVITP